MTEGMIPIYLEMGSKKVFAAGLDWPGWNRAGKDEDTACAALLAYGARYARVLRLERVVFIEPEELEQLRVAERLIGNAGTDFGAPNVPLAADAGPVPADELERLLAILSACWKGLAAAVETAAGKTLSVGPRGGGRSLEKMIEHVLEAERSYLGSLNRRIKPAEGEHLEQRIEAMRRVALDGLAAAVKEGLPEKGPRGGKIWQPRTYARRSAWHILDHAWELEDRSTPAE